MPCLLEGGGRDGGPPGLDCEGTQTIAGWEWRRWVDLDDRSRWAYEYKVVGKVLVGDQVEDFFARWDCELCGVW